MKSDYFGMAVKNLKTRKLRSWLTMIGIVIGIAAVVALIGLGEGLRAAIMAQFGFLGSDTLTVQASGLNYGPPGSGVATPLSDDLAGKISEINGVEAAFNRYIESGTVEFNNKQVIGFIGSAPDGDSRRMMETIANLRAAKGRLLKDGDTKRVVLGNSYSEDKSFGKPVSVGDKIIINNERFEVVGILEKKGSFFFDSIVLMNEKPLLNLVKKDGSKVNLIAIKVRDEKEMQRVKDDIEKLLRKERNVKIGEEDFIVESPQKTLDTLASTLFAVQLFVYIIAAISILVGGIGIMNTMYTAVLERTKEIGIMKSIGAQNSAIFSLFFLESGILGLIGGIIGALFGAALAYAFAFLGRLVFGVPLIQAKISLLLVIGALLFSFVVGLLSGTIPAYQASKKHPVDALGFVK